MTSSPTPWPRRGCSPARRGITVTGSADPGTTAEVDPRELSRALSNLVTNAVTHTPDDGTIDITLVASHGEARIGVRDECGGIPPEHLGRLFEPGWRGTTSRTPAAGEGAGLGLAVARGIARAHDGEVSVVDLGHACRFDLTVPAHPRPALPHSDDPERRLIRRLIGPGGSSLRISRHLLLWVGPNAVSLRISRHQMSP